jgi:esterase/lipase
LNFAAWTLAASAAILGPAAHAAEAAAAAGADPARAQPARAQPPPRIGVVIMHGKGGSPAERVQPLAAALAAKGYLVANIEMPWSEGRSYDVTVADAASQVESSLDELRGKGATRLFVAGHSQGGLFALYFGGNHRVDGIVAIAPGGNVASPASRERLAASLLQARRLIAEGKGNASSSDHCRRTR